MKIENGKITCTACGGKGANLKEQQEDAAVLECKHCKRRVTVSRIKLGNALFDKESMEGKSLV
jgi:translation initiation factor 2 beta subunit (eIF-2beta)/eIF-5